MASNKYLITIEWENDNFFQLLSKYNSEAPITVIKMDENTHFTELEDSIKKICSDYFERKIKEACDAMIA